MTLLAALVLIPAVLCFLYPVCFDNCLTRAIERWVDGRRLAQQQQEREQQQQRQKQENDNARPSAARQSDSASEADGASRASMTDAAAIAVANDAPEPPTKPWKEPPTAADALAEGDEGPHVVYRPDMPLSLWGRAAAYCASHPWPVLGVALLALVFPLYNVCAHFNYDDNYFASSPYTIPDWRDYADILGNFQREVDTPLTIFFSTTFDPYMAWDPDEPVLTEANWPLFIAAVEAVLASPLPVGGLDYVDAPCVLDGRIINFTEASYLVNATEWAPDDNTTSVPSPYSEQDVERGWRLRQLLRFLADTKMLSQQLAPAPLWPSSGNVVIRLRMPGSTWGRFGSGYLDQLNPVIFNDILPARDRLAPNTFVGFMGANADSWTVMRKVMKQFVLVIGITAAMLVLAILVLFRSVFFAAKMLFTMAYTVVFSFGLNITLYHYGWFNGAWFALDHVDKYFWLIIVIGFSVCCVLSLDYDVFLIIRVLEFRREHRFTDRQSVVHAVSRSGPVISYAALIMMIAFGALIFADTVMMSQFGLTLTLAVFLDAFVVRPLIVPALIAVVPTRAVWFPRRMPEPLYAEDELHATPTVEADGADGDAAAP